MKRSRAKQQRKMAWWFGDGVEVQEWVLRLFDYRRPR